MVSRWSSRATGLKEIRPQQNEGLRAAEICKTTYRMSVIWHTELCTNLKNKTCPTREGGKSPSAHPSNTLSTRKSWDHLQRSAWHVLPAWCATKEERIDSWEGYLKLEPSACIIITPPQHDGKRTQLSLGTFVCHRQE